MNQLDLRLCALIEERLARKGKLIIAIDGPCGAGKSTLGEKLHQHYKDSALFHMDDFFLKLHQRTPERLSEPGGNVDRERFLAEILLPLKAGLPFVYNKYDCQTGMMTSLEAQPASLNIIEGVYSLHPTLRDNYDLKVFLGIDPVTQLIRIKRRVPGSRALRFLEEWIPMEQRYFSLFQIRECCDLILTGSDENEDRLLKE